jgi:hypothetical protein
MGILKTASNFKAKMPSFRCGTFELVYMKLFGTFIAHKTPYKFAPYKLAISQSSRGLGLVACLEGQKINNMPNMASRKFSYIPKVICAA